jgi:hypothetical protein
MKSFCKPMQEQYQSPVFSAANLHVESQIQGRGNLLESDHRVDFVMSDAVSAVAKFGLRPVGKTRLLHAKQLMAPADLSFLSARFWVDQVSPVGTMAAVSTIKIALFSGARVQCNTPFGTVKPGLSSNSTERPS